MNTIESTIDSLLNFAKSDKELAYKLSYVQVEYGLKELEDLWQSFHEFYADSGQSGDIYLEFKGALSDVFYEIPEP